MEQLSEYSRLEGPILLDIEIIQTPRLRRILMSNANMKPNQYSSDEAKLIIEIVEGTLKIFFDF